MKLETIFAEIDISLLMMFVWMGVVTCKKKKKKLYNTKINLKSLDDEKVKTVNE